MKVTNKELDILIRKFKSLVEEDIIGITATDARNAVTEWLEETVDNEKADKFEQAVLAYQLSPKMVRMENKYNETC